MPKKQEKAQAWAAGIDGVVTEDGLAFDIFCSVRSLLSLFFHIQKSHSCLVPSFLKSFFGGMPEPIFFALSCDASVAKTSPEM